MAQEQLHPKHFRHSRLCLCCIGNSGNKPNLCHGWFSWKPLCSMSCFGDLGSALCVDTLCDASESHSERHHGTCDDNDIRDGPIDSTTVLQWRCCTSSAASKAKAEAIQAPPILHHRGRVDSIGGLVLLFRCQWQQLIHSNKRGLTRHRHYDHDVLFLSPLQWPCLLSSALEHELW